MSSVQSIEDKVHPSGETALAVPETPHSALVLPAVDAVAMKAAMKAYTELCEAVLVPTDYQTIGNKTFKKRSAWQKLATAFSVSTQIVDQVVHVDDDGRVIRAEFTIRATAPNGRHEDGYGAASRFERQFSKPDHDIPATAETRARNRACANLFAFGELTAEEMASENGEDGHATDAARQGMARRGAARQGKGDEEPRPAPRPVGKNLVPLKRVSRAQDSDGPEVGSATTSVAETPAPTTRLEQLVADAKPDSLAGLRQEMVERAAMLEVAERRQNGLEPLPEGAVLARAASRCNERLKKLYEKSLETASQSELEALGRTIDHAMRKLEES